MRPYLVLAALFLTACEGERPDIIVEQGWARATVAGQGGAAYLTIVNRGGNDRLIAVTVPRARNATLHSSSMDNGVMRMRPLTDGIEIPARATVELAPNGTHLMLGGLAAPLRPGEKLPATLRFAKAGAKQVTINVEQASAR